MRIKNITKHNLFFEFFKLNMTDLQEPQSEKYYFGDPPYWYKADLFLRNEQRK